MGLDITAYTKLEKIEGAFNPAEETVTTPDGEVLSYTEFTTFYANPDFPGRANGVEEGTPYKYGDTHQFRAGSYSGYNTWRNELAKMAGYQSASDVWRNHTQGPFIELISFSDCEGTLGPIVSWKLLQDFIEFEKRAQAHGETLEDEGWFFEKYQDWKKAFELAADHGAVSFH